MENNFQIEGSVFIQFLFNRLTKSRKTLYTGGMNDQFAINSVLSESVRTIRTFFTEGEKSNESMRTIINESFIFNLMGIEDATEFDIDALMSLIAESAYQRVAIGQPCINKQGKIFTVLGVFPENYMSSKYHEIPILPNNMPDNEKCMALAGLYYDPQHPERQDVMMERMIYTSPILDLEKE